MREIRLDTNCVVSCSTGEDYFVGIKCENGQIKVSFPMGFSLIDNPKIIRKDIRNLIRILSRERKNESEQGNKKRQYDIKSFPIQAYISIITDFFDRGYYIEREITYKTSLNGKIDWNKTVKRQKTYVQDNEFYYLEFTTKKNRIKENELITQIHEYCVYESFMKLGFLFGTNIPVQPRIRFQKNLFITVVKEKLANTFNDRNKQLFLDMLALIENLDTPEEDFWYGTYRFQYVWESLIDEMFGIEDKEKYFPCTYWNVDGGTYGNHQLEPDTIMIVGDSIYILDAKYYKYGVTKNVYDLPGTSSIEKQITYGEFIEKNREIDGLGKDVPIYNAFLMPYCSGNSELMFSNIGFGFSDWKSGNKKYENIKGILVDTRWLMENYISQCDEFNNKLVEIINI